MFQGQKDLIHFKSRLDSFPVESRQVKLFRQNPEERPEDEKRECFWWLFNKLF